MLPPKRSRLLGLPRLRKLHSLNMVLAGQRGLHTTRNRKGLRLKLKSCRPKLYVLFSYRTFVYSSFLVLLLWILLHICDVVSVESRRLHNMSSMLVYVRDAYNVFVTCFVCSGSRTPHSFILHQSFRILPPPFNTHFPPFLFLYPLLPNISVHWPSFPPLRPPIARSSITRPLAERHLGKNKLSERRL